MMVGSRSTWAYALTQISPYTFASIGIAISIGVSVLGAAWGIYITGSSLIHAAIKAPRIISNNLIWVNSGLDELELEVKKNSPPSQAGGKGRGRGRGKAKAETGEKLRTSWTPEEERSSSGLR